MMFFNKENYKKVFKIFISIILFGILLYFVDFGKALKIIDHAIISFLIITFFVCILDRFFMGWKWGLLLRTISDKINYWQASKIYYITSFEGLIIPFGVGGDVIRYWKIKKYGISNEDALASIVVERFFGLFSTGLMVIISFVLLLVQFTEIRLRQDFLYLFILVIITAIFIFLFTFNNIFRDAVIRIFRIKRMMEKLNIAKYFSAVTKFKDKKLILINFILLSFIEQLFAILVIYFVAKSLSMPLNFIECVTFVPISTFMERLPISFQGFGVREGSYVFLLGLIGINYTNAIVLSLLGYTIFLFSLIPAAIWSIFDGVKRKKIKNLEINGIKIKLK